MADSTPVTSPKKKLPFKRTMARRKSPDSAKDGAKKSKKDDDDDGISLFRRVDDEIAQVLEEQERRLKQKEKRISSSTATRTSPDHQDVKRRKLSIDLDEDRNDDTVTPRSVSNRDSIPRSASKGKLSSLALVDDDDLIMDVKGKGKEILRPKDVLKTDVISLDGDDDDDVKMSPSKETVQNHSTTSRRTRSQRRLDSEEENDNEPNPFADTPPSTKKPPDDDDDDLQIIEDGPPTVQDEPDEFEEYVRRARERAEERERQAKLKSERESQVKESQEAKPNGLGSFEITHESSGDSQGSISDDPVIKILVTSELPNSKPKMMERRYNQTLGLVRDAWAKGQNPPVPRDMWHLIFLTWKGNRVYSTTTCANLGVRVDSVSQSDKKGRLAGAKYAEWEHGSGFHRGGLHLEAWTEELYQEHLQKKERERLRLLGQLDDDDEYDDSAPGSGARASQAPAAAGGEAEATTRVILKAAKDYEPLRFKVHADTTIDEMIKTFRSSRKVPDDREISLFFDGEKLDGDMAVKDTEIEDMDSLEVHIK